MEQSMYAPTQHPLLKMIVPCLLAIGLTACGGSKPSADTTSQTASTTPESIATPAPQTGGVINVVTTGKEPPFSVVDEKGNLTGIDIDVMNAIAQSQGFTVKFDVLPWQTLLASVERGDYQVAINAIKYSDERDSLYGLSHPYFYDPSAFAYKKDSGISPKSLADLAGLKVGVMVKSKQEADMTNTQAIVVPHPNLFSAYRDMVQGKLDAVAYDLPVLQMTAKQQADQLIFVPYESRTDKGANTVIAVHKENQVLLDKINRGIDELVASGEIERIAKKHIENTPAK